MSATHVERAAEGSTSLQAKLQASPIDMAPAGTDSLNGQMRADTQTFRAVEGQDSPQANRSSSPIVEAPAGSTTAPSAKRDSTPTVGTPEGRKTSRSQGETDTHRGLAAADDLPGGQNPDAAHLLFAAGDQTSVPAISIATSIPHPSVRDQAPPAAKDTPAPNGAALLADYKRWPFLRMASRELDEIESVRIGTDNRLFQLISDRVDTDGQERGRGMLPPGICEPDDKDVVKKLLKHTRQLVSGGVILPPPGWDPYVWKLANLAAGIQQSEADATGQLEAELKKNPLWVWIEAQKGVGAKQAARFLVAIGDPLARPQIIHDDGTEEPARKRKVSELLSLCGHGDPARRPRKGMTQADAMALGNPEAKKRLRLIAMTCLKLDGKPDKNGRARARSPYRDVYEAARAEYATRIHKDECRNRKPYWQAPNGCGTSAHPEWGAPGTPWRDGHQLGSALRIVGKQFVKDLYREAERLQGGIDDE